MKYSIEISILLILAMLIGIVAFFLFAYYLLKCLQNIKSGKEFIVRANPLSFFFQTYFSDIGNLYRLKSIKFMIIGLLSVFFTFVIALLAESI